MRSEFRPVEDLLNQELEPVLLHALQRFRALLPGEVELALSLSHAQPYLRTNAVRLEQALLSVFIIAWHSMMGLATQIVVELDEVLLDEVVLNPEAGILQGGLPPRRYARLVVSNNLRLASGPEHELLPAPVQINDQPHGARRLSLVEVRNIIVQHQGMLNLSPEPGRGTAFDIYLPIALPPEAPAFSESGPGTKHIIYVDDYEAMRALISDTLPEAGFRVSCYENAQQALTALHADPMGCDAVVSDFRLQGYSGIELLRQVKRLRADLPVVIISGYVDEALRSNAQDAGAALVISKADDLSALCIALHQLLGHAPRPALLGYSDWTKL